MTEPVLPLTLPIGWTAAQLRALLAPLRDDAVLVGVAAGPDAITLGWVAGADRPAFADDGQTEADRTDRARTAPDRRTAARILTEGRDIPARGDLAAMLREAGWPCPTDTARDLRAELLAERMAGGGPELTAGTGG